MKGEKDDEVDEDEEEEEIVRKKRKGKGRKLISDSEDAEEVKRSDDQMDDAENEYVP